MVLIFEIRKAFVHERLCKFTLRIVGFICGDSTQHSSCETKRSCNRLLLTSSTVQAYQTPSSATASALKPTGCESVNTFSVTVHLVCFDESAFH